MSPESVYLGFNVNSMLFLFAKSFIYGPIMTLCAIICHVRTHTCEPLTPCMFVCFPNVSPSMMFEYSLCNFVTFLQFQQNFFGRTFNYYFSTMLVSLIQFFFSSSTFFAMHSILQLFFANEFVVLPLSLFCSYPTV